MTVARSHTQLLGPVSENESTVQEGLRLCVQQTAYLPGPRPCLQEQLAFPGALVPEEPEPICLENFLSDIASTCIGNHFK